MPNELLNMFHRPAFISLLKSETEAKYWLFLSFLMFTLEIPSSVFVTKSELSMQCKVITITLKDKEQNYRVRNSEMNIHCS